MAVVLVYCKDCKKAYSIDEDETISEALPGQIFTNDDIPVIEHDNGEKS